MVTLQKKEILYTFGRVDVPDDGAEHRFVCGPRWGVSRPSGLIVWGATDRSEITSIVCGQTSQASASGASIPARFFETGRTFAEIEALAEAGELEMSTPQRQIIRMSPLCPGMQLTVGVRGPLSNMVMWGHAFEESPAPVFAEIKQTDTEGRAFRARVVKPTLDGEHEVLVVEAPTVDACAHLVGPRLESIEKVHW